MKSFSLRFGGILVFIGVFVLSLDYVNWSTVSELERANLLIAAGVVMLVCFGAARWSRSLLLDEFIELLSIVVGAVILGLFISGSGVLNWASWAGPVRVDKTLSFDGSFAPDVTAPSIRFQLTNGTATVQTWEKDTYQIIVRERARGWSQGDAEKALETTELKPEVSATGIIFTVPRAPLGSSQVEADVQIFLPQGRLYELHLETLNGSLDVKAMSTTEAFLKTLNGRISGSLSAREAVASTTNGEINLTLGPTSGQYRASALNGHIEFHMPQDSQTEIGYSISARSLFGSVSVRLANFTFTEQDRRRVEGATSNFSISALKITVEAHTTNGSIDIR